MLGYPFSNSRKGWKTILPLHGLHNPCLDQTLKVNKSQHSSQQSMLTQLIECIYATRRVPSFSSEYRESPTQLAELTHQLVKLQRVQTHQGKS